MGLSVVRPALCNPSEQAAIVPQQVQTQPARDIVPAQSPSAVNAVQNTQPASEIKFVSEQTIAPKISDAVARPENRISIRMSNPAPASQSAASNQNLPAKQTFAAPSTQAPVSMTATPVPAPKELVFKMDPATPVKAITPVYNGGNLVINRVVDSTRNLVNRAFSWLGTRYVWGGTSRRGVDCSGLTRLLYGTEGVNLPHKAKLQFKRGQVVARNQLSPGDLVFFNTVGPISHVGIYIGEGKFLHAANPRRGVRIDSLNSAYYSKRFAGARRYKDSNIG